MNDFFFTQHFPFLFHYKKKDASQEHQKKQSSVQLISNRTVTQEAKEKEKKTKKSFFYVPEKEMMFNNLQISTLLSHAAEMQLSPFIKLLRGKRDDAEIKSGIKWNLKNEKKNYNSTTGGKEANPQDKQFFLKSAFKTSWKNKKLKSHHCG